MTRDGIKAIRPLIEQLPDFYHNSPEVVDLPKCIYQADKFCMDAA